MTQAQAQAQEGAQGVSEILEDTAQQFDAWQSSVFEYGIVDTLLLALVVAVVVFLLIKLLKRFFKKHEQGNLRFFFRLINIAIVVIGAFTVLNTITPLKQLSTTVLAGSGFLAVVIGIAAQASLGNVFSGISIGVSKPFVIGETIEIISQSLAGTVTEIGLRHTTIRDFNNKYIVIPNSVIDKEIIRTIRQGDTQLINFLTVQVSYESDVDAAIGVLKKAVLAHRFFFDPRSPQAAQSSTPDVDVFFTDLKDSGVELRASIWSKDPGQGFVMLSELRQTLLREFAAQGIEIPHPYQNVILKPERDQPKE